MEDVGVPMIKPSFFYSIFRKIQLYLLYYDVLDDKLLFNPLAHIVLGKNIMHYFSHVFMWPICVHVGDVEGSEF